MWCLFRARSRDGITLCAHLPVFGVACPLEPPSQIATVEQRRERVAVVSALANRLADRGCREGRAATLESVREAQKSGRPCTDIRAVSRLPETSGSGTLHAARRTASTNAVPPRLCHFPWGCAGIMLPGPSPSVVALHTANARRSSALMRSTCQRTDLASIMTLASDFHSRSWSARPWREFRKMHSAAVASRSAPSRADAGVASRPVAEQVPAHTGPAGEPSCPVRLVSSTSSPISPNDRIVTDKPRDSLWPDGSIGTARIRGIRGFQASAASRSSSAGDRTHTMPWKIVLHGIGDSVPVGITVPTIGQTTPRSLTSTFGDARCAESTIRMALCN